MVGSEIREKVQGARDEHGPLRACELERAGAGGGRIGLDLDPLEVRGGERGELVGRERAAVASSRSRRASSRAPTSASSIIPGRLSRRIEADDGPAAERRRREPRQQPADAGEVVRAVPDLERSLAAALESAGSAIASAACGSTGAAEERLGGRDRRGRGCCRPVTTTAAAPFSSASSRHSGSPSTTVAARLHDRELLGGDRLARVAEHVHVVERDVREDDDARARTFVASWRPPSPASTTATLDLRFRERERAPPP